MSRVLIEFFDDEFSDNIAALVNGEYSKVVYLAHDGIPSSRTMIDYERVLSTHFGVEVEYLSETFGTIEEAAAAIKRKAGDGECHIDLTGGSGMYAAAAGYYIRSNPENTVLLLFDPKDGSLVFASDPNYKPVPGTPLTFTEIMEMNSHKMLSFAGNGEYDFSNQALRSEVLRLWDATKGIPSDWNRFCSLPQEDVTAGHVHPRLRRKLKKSEDRVVCERVMSSMKKKHIVYDYSFVRDKEREYVSYELYRSAKTKSLYDKGGTALEMYVCLAASECGIFKDCRSGVALDLDGVVTNRTSDPRNEIDVTGMIGNTPVLISCKNTTPTKEFLYEIREMTRYFGGENAIAALACTPVAMAAVRERAEQMNIILLDDIFKMTLTGFKEKMVSAFGK